MRPTGEHDLEKVCAVFVNTRWRVKQHYVWSMRRYLVPKFAAALDGFKLVGIVRVKRP